MPRTTIFRSKLSGVLTLFAVAAGPWSAAVAQAASKPSTYKVKAGDTLFSIARQLLGDPALWIRIYRLNTDVIDDPGHIVPGQVLKVAGSGGVSAVSTQETPAPEKAVAEKGPTPKSEKAAEPNGADKAKEPKPTEKRPEMTMPTPQPSRPAVVVEPADEQQVSGPDSTFAKRKGMDARAALRTYREQPYRPLRRGEFFAAGFLTEEQRLPFGRLLGTITPQQIRNASERATATLYSTVAIEPPAGAKYAVGDSVLLVQTSEGPNGYGEIVVPTGMARITGSNGNQALATIVAVYGPIRNGQLSVPAEKFVEGGTARAQPVSNGVTGTVLAQRETRELIHPAEFFFIDKGKKDGVARGDIFEVRRTAGPRIGAADTADELMATVQVVHVRDRSATVRVLSVVSPDIPPGTRVKQVGKLPS